MAPQHTDQAPLQRLENLEWFPLPLPKPVRIHDHLLEEDYLDTPLSQRLQRSLELSPPFYENERLNLLPRANH
jgi:hypothetical protein